MTREFQYNRVLLKISGEALKGGESHGYDAEAVRAVVKQVKDILDRGVEIALVVGAGNIWRGVMGRSGGMDRVNADYMGMLATVMNALCLRDFFRAAGGSGAGAVLDRHGARRSPFRPRRGDPGDGGPGSW